MKHMTTSSNHSLDHCDRAISSIPFIHTFSSFSDSIIDHLTRFDSDYCPILLSVHHINHIIMPPFRFEKFWLTREGVHETIKCGWICDETYAPDKKLQQLLSNIKCALQKWKHMTETYFKGELCLVTVFSDCKILKPNKVASLMPNIIIY